jgi:hypothetical protein
LSVTAVTAADTNDLYGDWGAFFADSYDPNVGLTLFPTLLIPAGGRSQGMGSAYTALATDSAFIEVNPAGSALLERPQLSFLHHNWIADAAIETAVLGMRFGRVGYGIGVKFLHNAFTEYDDQGERAASGHFTETVVTVNTSTRLISVPGTATLSMGVNLKAVYRHVPSVFAENQSAYALPIDAGLLTRFHLLDLSGRQGENFSLGVAVKNLGQKVESLGYPLPTVASAGIGYRPVGPLTLSGDFNLPISLEPDEFPAERYDWAAGFAVRVAPFLSVHGGFRNKADNPKVSLGSQIDLAPVSFVVNYNLDLMGDLNPLDRFSLEATLPLGAPESRGAR